MEKRDLDLLSLSLSCKYHAMWMEKRDLDLLSLSLSCKYHAMWMEKRDLDLVSSFCCLGCPGIFCRAQAGALGRGSVGTTRI